MLKKKKLHLTYIYIYIYINIYKLGHPIVPPYCPLLAEITWSNHLLYNFIGLTSFLKGFLAHSFLKIFLQHPVYWGLWALVYAQFSPQHFSQDELWTLTGLLQNLDSFLFSPSVVDLRVCLRLLSCCITQFWPNFSCRTDDLTFDSRILW